MKIAFLFPGYGSQFVGMGKELYDESRLIQEYFEEAGNCLDKNFVKLCFAASDAEISKIENAYIVTFLVSSAICSLLKQEKIMPTVVAGYNHGEYAALFAAGGINFPDGLYLLNKFAFLYQESLYNLPVQCMRVRGVSTKKIEDICKQVRDMNEFVSVAIYITDTDHIVAGYENAVRLVSDVVAQKQGSETSVVGTEVGLHSKLMYEVTEKFKPYLEKADFKDVLVPFINCYDGELIMQGSDVKSHIINHITMPVRWAQIMASLNSYDILVEVGPGSQLSKIARHMYPDKKIIAINKRTDIDELHAAMS